MSPVACDLVVIHGMRHLLQVAAILVAACIAMPCSAGVFGGGFGSGGSSSGSGSGSGTGSSSSSSTSYGGFSENEKPNSLTAAINSSYLCVRWMITGVCYDEIMVVSHYYPVAYITTTTKADPAVKSGSGSGAGGGFGGSLMSGSGNASSGQSTSSNGTTNAGSGASGSASTGVSGQSTRIKKDSKNRQMAWDAIVWQITSDERDDALEQYDGCLCEYTDKPSGSVNSSFGSGNSGKMSSLNGQENCDKYNDGSSSGMGGSTGGSMGSSSGGSMGGSSGSSERSVFYNSTRDGNNWRKGCRDLANKDNKGGLGGLTGGGGLSSLMGGNGDYDLEGCKSNVTGISFDFNSMMNQGCLDSWGSLYPRYTLTRGTTEIISSAKIAYRAAHVAADPIGKLGQTVDKNALIQQVTPRKSMCFGIGTTPLIMDLMAGASSDGKYAWILWTRFGCCKEVSSCGS